MVLGSVGHVGAALDHTDIDDVAPGVARGPAEPADRNAARVGVDRGGERADRGRECCQRRNADQHARNEQRAGTVEDVRQDGAGQPDAERPEGG